MKAILYRIALSAIILAGLAAVSSAAPKMALSEPSFDFGTVPQHASVSHVFWLKSVGDETLKIVRIKPGCGCTKVPLEKSEIAVGDSARMEIIFETGRYHNHVTRKPRIETNEMTPRRTITFSANVIGPTDASYPLVIVPSTLELSSSATVEPSEMSFAIRNVSDKDIRPVLIDHPDGMFEVELPDEIKAGQAVTAVIKLHVDAAAKSFKKSFTIGTGSDQSKRFTVPVVHTARSLGSR